MARFLHSETPFITMKHSAAICAWLLATHAVLAIDDIPEGGFLWLQGYDLNPPTAGFRVDGQLRIESTDEPQAVGINVSSGRVTNSVIGTIFVNTGPGGTRFIYGDLLNDGLLKLQSLLLFSRDGADLVNRGKITAAGGAGLAMTGKETVFHQQGGEIQLTDFTSRFEFYNQSTLVYEGGTISGEALVASSHVRILSPPTEPLHFRFGGPDSTFGGHYPTNQTLRIWGDSRFGAASVSLTNTPSMQGTAMLWANPGLGNPGATLRMPSAGTVVGETALIQALAGSDPLLIQGPWENRGLIDIHSLLQFRSSNATWTNHGTINIVSGGGLDCGPALVQSGGKINVGSEGAIAAVRGFALNGGTFSLQGTVYGPVTNRSVALLDQNVRGLVTSSWTQTHDGVLDVTVKRTGENGPVAMDVRGVLQLGGTLRLHLASGVVPANGSVFTVLYGAQMQGWFDKLELPPLPNGLHWEVLPDSNLVRFVVRDGVPQIRLQLVRSDSGDRMQIIGPITNGVTMTLRGTQDFKTWNRLLTLNPFNGVGALPVNAPGGIDDNAAVFYDAVMTSP